jgi:hypothetical protein
MAALVNPENPARTLALKAMESIAKVQNVELQVAEARGPQDLPGVFSGMVKRRVEAISVLDDAMLIANAPQIADLAVRNRLPTSGFREIADAGGLMAYAVNFPAAWRRAAVFIDKICGVSVPLRPVSAVNQRCTASVSVGAGSSAFRNRGSPTSSAGFRIGPLTVGADDVSYRTNMGFAAAAVAGAEGVLPTGARRSLGSQLRHDRQDRGRHGVADSDDP